MNCHECDGTGYVLKRGDYRSRFTGKMHSGAEFVIRCPLYTEYFDNVSDPLQDVVIFHERTCSAASRRHEEIKTRGERKDKGRRGGP